jgi:hypothetical protein
MRGYVVPLVAVLALAACRKDPPKGEADEKAKATASTAQDKAARPPKPPADEGIDVPTEEDFEEAVAKQITPEADLAKELEKLEQEIGE